MEGENEYITVRQALGPLSRPNTATNARRTFRYLLPISLCAYRAPQLSNQTPSGPEQMGAGGFPVHPKGFWGPKNQSLKLTWNAEDNNLLPEDN